MAAVSNELLPGSVDRTPYAFHIVGCPLGHKDRIFEGCSSSSGSEMCGLFPMSDQRKRPNINESDCLSALSFIKPRFCRNDYWLIRAVPVDPGPSRGPSLLGFTTCLTTAPDRRGVPSPRGSTDHPASTPRQPWAVLAGRPKREGGRRPVVRHEGPTGNGHSLKESWVHGWHGERRTGGPGSSMFRGPNKWFSLPLSMTISEQ